MSTAFYKIFDLILATAKKEKLAPEDMVGKLFVFSDMQFDQCGGSQYKGPAYETAKHKSGAAGYPMPELIFWNLAARSNGGRPATKPVRADTPGVSLVSGFSSNLMKYFLGQAKEEEGEDKLEEEWETLQKEFAISSIGKKEKMKKDPLETLMAIIGAESFKGVIVVD